MTQDPQRPQPPSDAVTQLPSEARCRIRPRNLALPDSARDCWLEADWRQLAQLAPESLAHHPERAQLAAASAAASLQIGEANQARAAAKQALEWGCDRELLGKLLLAGARHTLARASFFAGRTHQSRSHFEKAVSMARLSSEVRRRLQHRQDAAAEDLRAATAAATALRKNGMNSTSAKAPAWLSGMAERCLAAKNSQMQIDRVMRDMLSLPNEKARFLLLISDGWLERRDLMAALQPLRQAMVLAKELEPELRAELVHKLVAAERFESAVRTP